MSIVTFPDPNRDIGGRVAYASIQPDVLLASTGGGAFQNFANSYFLPLPPTAPNLSDAIPVGGFLRVQALARVANGAGANLLTFRLAIGGGFFTVSTTPVLSTTPGDFQMIDLTACRNTDNSIFGAWTTDAAGVQVNRAFNTDFGFAWFGAGVNVQPSARWSGVTPGTSVELQVFNVFVG